MTNPMDDITANARAMFIIGSNTTEQHPVFGARIRQAVLKRDVKLVVADPRKIDITKFAALHLRLKPGTDIALVNGLMHIILENGWEDRAYIETRTEGFEEFRQNLLDYPPQKVAEITGVPVEQLFQAAEILALSKPAAVMWAMGITQHTVGVQNVMTLANLQMLTGNVGVPGGGVNPLRGQNNVQGACDMGGLPNYYPGYQWVNQAEAVEKFEKAWGAQQSGKIGLTVTEMMPAAARGEVKALYVIGENPVTSDPDGHHIRRALEELDFLLLQEIFPSETAVYADIILPAATFAEKSGTFTNTERRIQMVRQAITPPGDARPDWQITSDLARQMLALGGDRQVDFSAQHAAWNYNGTEEIMTEISALTPSYAGISHSRVESGERLHWPVRGKDQPGTPILHVGKFTRGPGKFSSTHHLPPVEMPDADYPMLFTTGRVLYHWHGGEMTRRASGLLEVYSKSLVELNPADADRLGLAPGGKIRITSRRGSIQADAWITDRVPPGVVHANFHFPEVPANDLTLAALDPVAKIPEYKVCAVKIEPV